MRDQLLLRINSIHSDLQERTGIDFNISESRDHITYNAQVEGVDVNINIDKGQFFLPQVNFWTYCANPSEDYWVSRRSHDFVEDVARVVEKKQFDPKYLEKLK